VLPTPQRSARKKDAMRPHAGVTSLAYLADGRVLVSGGAADGAIKLWEMRAGAAGRGPAVPLLVVPPLPGRRLAGISAVDTAPGGRRLLALRKDGVLGLYDGLRPDGTAREATPAARCSFYVKAAFSHCGRFAARGSSDGDVAVCAAAGTDGGGGSSSWALQAHSREVSGVAAAAHVGDCGLVTCGDDGTVCLWEGRLRRRATPE
jgi:WD40 repeat protein